MIDKEEGTNQEGRMKDRGKKEWKKKGLNERRKEKGKERGNVCDEKA